MLSSDEPYKLKEKIDEAASMPTEGPQEEPSSTKEGEEDLIRKKAKTKTKTETFNTSQILTIDMPHGQIVRQLNCSGMTTQGRAGIVDTALASSHFISF